MLPEAHDVLKDHDGIIHHDPDSQRKPQHRKRVEREAEKVDHNERSQDGGRDRQKNIERRAPGTQEKPAHQRRHQCGKDQGKGKLVDRILDKTRAVNDYIGLHISRETLFDLGQARLDGVRHGHVVDAALFLDPQAGRRSSVKTRYPADIIKTILDAGHVLEIDRGIDRAAGSCGDQDVTEFPDRTGLTHHPYALLFPVGLNDACGELGMPLVDGANDILHR